MVDILGRLHLHMNFRIGVSILGRWGERPAGILLVNVLNLNIILKSMHLSVLIHDHGVTFHLYLSTMFCSFQCQCLDLILLNLFLSISDAIVNEINFIFILFIASTNFVYLILQP